MCYLRKQKETHTTRLIQSIFDGKRRHQLRRYPNQLDQSQWVEALSHANLLSVSLFAKAYSSAFLELNIRHELQSQS